jgi:hypothetical protein
MAVIPGADTTPPLRWNKALLVPRRFSLTATAGLAGVAAIHELYRPRRPAARLACAFTLAGARRGLGMGASVLDGRLSELFGLLGVAPDGGALMRSKRSDRLILALTEGGRLSVVVKLASPDDTAVAREADALRRLRGEVAGALLPELRWSGRWRDRLVVATEALVSSDNARDVDLEQATEVAVALARGSETYGPIVHGDLAPWNMLQTSAGVALVDWESSRIEADPLFDLSHFVVSTGALLGWHRPPQAVAALTAEGSAGWRYLERLDLDPRRAPQLLDGYLQRTDGRSGKVRRYRQAVSDHLADVLRGAPDGLRGAKKRVAEEGGN